MGHCFNAAAQHKQGKHAAQDQGQCASVLGTVGFALVHIYSSVVCSSVQVLYSLGYRVVNHTACGYRAGVLAELEQEHTVLGFA